MSQTYQARAEAAPTRETELVELTRDYTTLQLIVARISWARRRTRRLPPTSNGGRSVRRSSCWIRRGCQSDRSVPIGAHQSEWHARRPRDSAWAGSCCSNIAIRRSRRMTKSRDGWRCRFWRSCPLMQSDAERRQASRRRHRGSRAGIDRDGVPGRRPLHIRPVIGHA